MLQNKNRNFSRVGSNTRDRSWRFRQTHICIYIYIPAFPRANDIHIHMYIQIVHLPGIPRAAFYIYTQIYLPGIPRAALCIILYRYKTYTQTCISLAFRGPQDHVSFPHSGSVAPFCFYTSDQPRTARKSGSVSCRGVTTWWDLTKYHPTKRRWDLTTKSTRPPFAANGCAQQHGSRSNHLEYSRRLLLAPRPSLL